MIQNWVKQWRSKLTNQNSHVHQRSLIKLSDFSCCRSQVSWHTLEPTATWKIHIFIKRMQLGLKLSPNYKVWLYKTIVKPEWTYEAPSASLQRLPTRSFNASYYEIYRGSQPLVQWLSTAYKCEWTLIP